MSLTLSLAGISVTLEKFLSTDYPRITIESLAAVEFSALGTPAISGSQFEPKFLWNISCLVNQQQRDLLEAIAYEFQTRRRALQACDILIYDRTATLKERSPRSRALVPTTAELSLNGGTHTAYYGQFYAGITEGPRFTKQGRLDAMSLVLTETIKVSA